MSLLDHLAELRHRVVIIVLAVAAGSIIGWFLYEPVFRLMTNSYCTYMTAHPDLAVDPNEPCRLAYTTILEPFSIKLKITIFLGVAIALPVVIWQIWRFITPGLNPNERRYVVPFTVASVVLFALGALFAIITMPRALNFLLGFAGTTRIVAVLRIGSYLSFFVWMIVAFGASFEFPIVLLSLVVAGVLTSAKLRAWRRYAVLVIAIVAAVITPSQDWFTMTMMMVPLLIFYELSILVARFVLKR